MLAIRLQRLGRKGYPTYRLAVQEAQRHPTSGRVVAYVGSYNPHTKESRVDAEKIAVYLGNGAQPTPRVVRILRDNKVGMPDWVKVPADKNRDIKHAEKLRRNQPVQEVVEAPVETVAEVPVEAVEEAVVADEPADVAAAESEDAPEAEVAQEAPADTKDKKA